MAGGERTVVRIFFDGTDRVQLDLLTDGRSQDDLFKVIGACYAAASRASSFLEWDDVDPEQVKKTRRLLDEDGKEKKA